MKTQTSTVLHVQATYACASTYDNAIDITDASGNKLSLKGLTNEQLDSLCSQWLRSRLGKDANIKNQKPYDFTRLQEALNEMWPAKVLLPGEQA